MNAAPGIEPSGAGAGDFRLGPYFLEVGDVAGTKLSFTTAEDRRQASELAKALREGEENQEVAAPLDRLDHALDETEEVTGKVERAANLLTAIAEGRADPQLIGAELDALLDLVERLDREGRFKDALLLARALSALLALLGRWVALAHTLYTALRAARAISDLDGEAWALHELGTFALGGADADAAAEQLGRARALRERLGDREGLAATDQNLAVARRVLASVGGAGGRPRGLRGRMAIGVASALFAAAGLAVGWVVGAAGNNKTTTTLTTSGAAPQATPSTSTATATLTTTTTSISTVTTTVFTTSPSPGLK